MAHTLNQRSLHTRRANFVSYYNTAAGAAAETLAPGIPFRLVHLHMECSDTTASENFTITMDNGLGAAYDAILYSTDLNGGKNLSKSWGNEEMWFHGDAELDIAYANSNSRTWGLEIIVELG